MGRSEPKMNVLVIGVFDSSGYGRSSIDLALAIDAAGGDVVCRRLNLDNRLYTLPDRIKALLAKPKLPGGYDACLQCFLPHQMRSHGDLPTVGYFFWETSHFRSSNWASHLNRLSAVISPAGNTRAACLASGVTIPIYDIPMPCDVRRYEQSYKPLSSLASLRDSGAFLFYSIGEFIRRKAWKDLLTAYYLEFTPRDNVHFVVKTHKSGVDNGVFVQEFSQWNNKLFASLKLHANTDRYPPVSLINQHLDDEEICRLHTSCDCYVSASHGEGYNLPSFDAMAFGKTPIVPRHSGYLSWADDVVGWTCDAHKTPCQGVVDSFPDLYRADENWYQIDIDSLRRAMRSAYSNEEARKAKAAAGCERAYHYAYEVIGPRLLEVLQDATRTGLDGSKRLSGHAASCG